MVDIEQINCNEDAKICDKLLNELIQSEHKFNNNIKKDYVVKDYFEKIYNCYEKCEEEYYKKLYEKEAN